MKKLVTIQKKNKLDDVYAVDERGEDNAYHRYVICKIGDISWCEGNNSESVYADVQFQKGGRLEESSLNGIIDVDLLEIVRHRLQSFQAGGYSSRENACALTHIEEALMWLNKRVEDRAERNVLGTNYK